MFVWLTTLFFMPVVTMYILLKSPWRFHINSLKINKIYSSVVTESTKKKKGTY